MIGRAFSKYRILAPLGKGGMGEVFLAEDTVLDRKVALKFFPESMQPDPSVHHRILQEARAAAALDHPYICQVHEVGELEGRHFIAMEYVEGETLKNSLSNRPLGLDEALRDAAEIADALDAAHSRGVVHRDLKPSNIMRTAQGHIKVMDFGLARLVQTRKDTGTGDDTLSASVTRSGALVGTLAYMSPEQVRTEPADARSDIFALGVVLYEMISGKHPFQRPSALETASAILRDDPPRISQFVADAPVGLQQALDSMMAKDPALRPPSARAALQALQESRKPSSPVRRLSRRILTAALVVAASAATWLAVRPPISPESAAVGAGSEMLLAEIANRTQDAQLTNLQLVLDYKLRQSPHIMLLDAPRVQEILARMRREPGQKLDPDTTREVAWRAGVPLVGLATVAQVDAQFFFEVVVEKTGETPTEPKGHWTNQFPARSKAQLPQAVDAAVRWIREILGEAAQTRTELDLPAKEVTTGSWEALDFFSRAEAFKERGRDEDAVSMLEAAVAADPQFALAHMRLGDILFGLRREQEGLAHYREALASLSAGRLTRREEWRIRGLYAHDTWDYAQAEQWFSRYALGYPRDFYPFFYRGLALKEAGRMQDAIDQFRKAAALRPTLYHPVAHLALSHMIVGQLDDAREQIRRLQDMGAPREWAESLQATLDTLAGRYEDAAKRLEVLCRSGDAGLQTRGYGLAAALAGERGRFREALQLLDSGIEVDRGSATRDAARADKLLARASILLDLNRLQEVRGSCIEAAALDQSPARLARAGTLLARAGFAPDAAALLSSLDKDSRAPLIRIARFRISGEIHAADGDWQAALRDLQSASGLEPAPAPREYLARALEKAGRSAEAVGVYRKLVDSPGRLWQDATQESPGIWADALYHYAILASTLEPPPDLRVAIRHYTELRSGADPGFAGMESIRRIGRMLK